MTKAFNLTATTRTETGPTQKTTRCGIWTSPQLPSAQSIQNLLHLQQRVWEVRNTPLRRERYWGGWYIYDPPIFIALMSCPGRRASNRFTFMTPRRTWSPTTNFCASSSFFTLQWVWPSPWQNTRMEVAVQVKPRGDLKILKNVISDAPYCCVLSRCSKLLQMPLGQTHKASRGHQSQGWRIAYSVAWLG